MTDRLRVHWDFADLDATERRLRAALAEEATEEGRAEVLTQLARVDGLRSDIEAAELLLEEAAELAGTNATAAARIDLERGRLRRSEGDRRKAHPLFESAFGTATAAEEWFIAADAAHMAALAAPDREGFAVWTERGLALASDHAAAAYWAGPLLNNLGWERYEAGELEQALDAFERALRAREDDPADQHAIALARYAVGKTLRALGRYHDAIPLLEQAVALAAREGRPDGWFHEELAEGYAAVGRVDEAREQARHALPLLDVADPSFSEDAERSSRLRALASGNAARRVPDGNLRTALLVAVPEAASVVDGWRERTCHAKPSAGIPAHVTVLFPFVPAADLTEALVDDLRRLFGRLESFPASLATTARFESVLYLVPSPAEPFVRLTETVVRAYPDYPPYGGAFDAVVPHLTVAEGDPATLDEAEHEILGSLPIATRAAEVELLVELEPDSARWEARAAFPLGDSP